MEHVNITCVNVEYNLTLKMTIGCPFCL